MDDNELLALLASSPAEGIQAAIAKYGGIVKATVINVLGRDHSEIDECISDTFFKLWNSMNKTGLPKSEIKPYIIKIAKNTAIDTYRKHKTFPKMAELDDTLEADYNLEDEYARSENARIVKGCVDSLPEPDRTVFLRRYYLFERVKDISQSTGLDRKQVENILYRGKKKLEQYLVERGVTK